MAFTKFTNLDYDQIKESIKDYLRANSNFTGFDFEGSNFSVLIDTLAYNTYVNAVNANLVVNESFLDSATLRQNVVSLARNIGYVPRSRSASKAKVIITVPTDSTSPTMTLKAGLVCLGRQESTNYLFSIPEDITTTIEEGVAQFGTEDQPIDVFQGTYLFNTYTVNGSVDQRFIINNPDMDYSTLVVRVRDANEDGPGQVWKLVDNITDVTGDSQVYLIQEVQQEKYEILFGDGIFGKPLENGQIITASYIVTDGKEGDGPREFSYSGSIANSNGVIITPSDTPTVETVEAAQYGADIEPIESIKYFAPRLYSSQYRAVTTRDYEAILKQIYPNTESVSVVGGEELNPPKFGSVQISIKPRNGTKISEFDKEQILTGLKSYSVTGINQEIVDLKLLYIELDTAVYYDNTQVASGEGLRSRIVETLNDYADSLGLNKFGGRFKYSKLQKVIDDVDTAITSNITKIIMRRNLNAVINQFAQYEICFGNQFNIKAGGLNIKSSGFTIAGNVATLYLTDIPNKDQNGNLDGSGKGILSVVQQVVTAEGELVNQVIVKSAGIVDYTKGEVILNTINITSTVLPNNVIEIQAIPDSNDIIGLKDLYLTLDISKSKINMVKDTISSGEQISGVGYKITSSYNNGQLSR